MQYHMHIGPGDEDVSLSKMTPEEAEELCTPVDLVDVRDVLPPEADSHHYD